MNFEIPKNWNHWKTILRFVFDIVPSVAVDQGLSVNDEREIWGEVQYEKCKPNVITCRIRTIPSVISI